MGKYFTPSGKSPQKVGIASDIVIPTICNNDIERVVDDPFESKYEELDTRRVEDFKKYPYKYAEVLPLLKHDSKIRIATNPFFKTSKTEEFSNIEELLLTQKAIKDETLTIMKDMLKIMSNIETDDELAVIE